MDKVSDPRLQRMWDFYHLAEAQVALQGYLPELLRRLEAGEEAREGLKATPVSAGGGGMIGVVVRDSSNKQIVFLDFRTYPDLVAVRRDAVATLMACDAAEKMAAKGGGTDV